MIFSVLKKLLLSASLIVCLDYLIVDVPESESITIDSSLADFFKDLKNSSDQTTLYQKLQAYGWQKKDTAYLKKIDETTNALATILNVD